MLMKQAEKISLYWDHSHIWGFLAWHSLHSLGLPYRIVSAKDILNEGIKTNLLLVPGGSAKHKSQELGSKGLEIIKKFIADGGKYLGFCGGAGFALSEKESLGICPWKRSTIHDRLLHHVSGHLYVTCSDDKIIPSDKENKTLPVWFPARFASDSDTSKENTPRVLARYSKISTDLYLSDLPLSLFKPEYAQESFDMYGKKLDPLLYGEPTTIRGEYGKGEYIISYAHLETPNSCFANRFYFNILEDFAQLDNISANCVPELKLSSLEIKWQDDLLARTQMKLESLFNLALDLHLLFYRTPWLYGWKTGLQGVQLANLRMALSVLQNLPPNDKMFQKWNKSKEDFENLFDIFYEGVQSWFYARRLCLSLPDVISPDLLSDQQARLFGKAMEMGGICSDLVRILEDIFILQD